MSRVIRGKDPKVVPGEVVDATERAKEIVADAEANAAAHLEEARREAETIRTRAREQGLAEGRAEVAALLVQAHRARDQARSDAEPALVRLAVGAAEQLLGAELTLDPTRVRELVREVLDRARRAEDLRLRAHPTDAEALRGDPALSGIAIEEDVSLARGDCVIDTDLGRLDGRLAVRIDALRAAIENR